MYSKLALGCYTVFILVIFLLAYLRLLPSNLIPLKWFDLAGHFTLYGLWGYFFSAAYPTTLFEIGRFKVAQGIIFSTCIAIAEELLQLLSPNRSFTFSDMAFSTLGIFCAAVYLNFKSKPDFQS